ncbi:YoaK family protein [uncultured Leifsonia sp.]|uniref:YoaK family protein n=1 Tax=uncultured Leifsonia sp. TaxID=340359 RepID=UPI0028D79E5A|nr:YoaK family protein [uncultured Leifsonia sp.]
MMSTPVTEQQTRRPSVLQRIAHLAPMLALTFTTGIVDAVGYLGLDRVFTGNMTGNVVILGMALAGADSLPIVGPALALGAFLVGAIVSGRVLRTAGTGWTRRTTTMFAVVAVVVAGTGALAAVAGRPAEPVALTITGGIAFAMGLQAAAARHLSVADVTTVVVTSTITGLAADSWLGLRTGQRWPRRVLAIALIAAGAFAGAVLLRVHLAAGLFVAAALIAAAVLFGHTVAARDARQSATGESRPA